MDREFLVEQAQPFGKVVNSKVMPGTPCDYGYSAKSLGDTTVRNNHGVNHGPSFADKGAGAQSYAHRYMDNPFAPTGHPVRRV